jgi:hypothetical protein
MDLVYMVLYRVNLLWGTAWGRGYHILSQYVRHNASKIDFSGFAPILDRLTAAIEDYETKSAKPLAAANVLTGP